MLGAVKASYTVVISFIVQGPFDLTRKTEAVIDTDFTGFLSLPPALVAVPNQRIGDAGRRQSSEVQRPRLHGPLG